MKNKELEELAKLAPFVALPAHTFPVQDNSGARAHLYSSTIVAALNDWVRLREYYKRIESALIDLNRSVFDLCDVAVAGKATATEVIGGVVETMTIANLYRDRNQKEI